jgi:hypothetical protein
MHKSNVLKQNYRNLRMGSVCASSKPDIPPDRRWRIPMTKMILAALTVLSLGAGAANAQGLGHVASQQTAAHPGPYDNTANSLGGRYVGGA